MMWTRKRQYSYLPFSLFLGTASINAYAGMMTPFINEIHYDNTGTDTGEAVEIAGSSGTDLNGWHLLLINGQDSEVYKDIPLAETLVDSGNGWGFTTIGFTSNGLQNGGSSGDGLMLVDQSGEVTQFLDYEGAINIYLNQTSYTSTGIGVFEDTDTPQNFSLQLGGTGTAYEHFTWQSAQENTFGNANHNQFVIAPVPIPPTLPMFAGALAGLFWLRGRLNMHGTFRHLLKA